MVAQLELHAKSIQRKFCWLGKATPRAADLNPGDGIRDQPWPRNRSADSAVPVDARMSELQLCYALTSSSHAVVRTKQLPYVMQTAVRSRQENQPRPKLPATARGALLCGTEWQRGSATVNARSSTSLR